MITLTPIGVVRSPRDDLTEDGWGTVESMIELVPEIPSSSLDGLEAFTDWAGMQG